MEMHQFNENRQAGDMVHVRVSDDNVADLLTLLSVERQRNTACVNRNRFVNKKARQALF